MTGPPDAVADAGFVLMDGLIGLALVATIGTAAVVAGLQMADRQVQDRNRSVALTMGRSLVVEYLLTEGRSARQFPISDELFSYELRWSPADASGTGVQEVVMHATPLRGVGGEAVMQPFLAPARFSRWQ